ncbi:type II toxin-antitoxin system VapB family antitoxin [Ornithinimicrobium sp. F0845]|uniref:type II toxin-antitoxin system VapB family antitoxin n=1 Tax=Ornithinimicrobium sp. F0845 TaxID=2926412 RepID=UPI001FF1DA6E|nr:type II toxin-antitoxin system VapB family antitoxin [Ornithinimicrobium sp. F0845]MCK0111544.1 type II toxin-antitoxin system VapB family antitoxin [Ornithinimicrobium sp. F0845]
MAINIKNPHVVELVRRAAHASGRSQVSVLEEALERYLRDLEPRASRSPDRIGEILATLDAAITPADAEAIRLTIDSLYDDEGLPA